MEQFRVLDLKRVPRVPLDTGLERIIAYFDHLLAGGGEKSEVLQLRT